MTLSGLPNIKVARCHSERTKSINSLCENVIKDPTLPNRKSELVAQLDRLQSEHPTVDVVYLNARTFDCLGDTANAMSAYCEVVRLATAYSDAPGIGKMVEISISRMKELVSKTGSYELR